MSRALGILFAGVSVGILVGLSASPVVGSVISAMLGLVASGVALLSGMKHPKGGIAVSIDVWPVSILFVGVMLGSLCGVRLRSVEWLHAEPDTALNRWTAQPFGLPRNVVAERLFENYYPKEAEAASKHSPIDNSLYAAAQPDDLLSVCQKITGADPQQVPEILADARSSAYWRQIDDLTKNLKTPELVTVLTNLCPGRK